MPLHKAVYKGHADIAQLLVMRSGINLNYRGATNGYTPLQRLTTARRNRAP